MKILYVTTVGITMGFFKSFIRELLDEGHIVDIATNESEYEVPGEYREWGCNVYSLGCTRNPLAKGNLKAIKQIEEIVRENSYEVVHCHTPIAAACTRIACRELRKKERIRVIYTAHGFHFYKGAPLINWLIYYPIEKICSYFTDVLITINTEDFARAKKRMRAKRIVYIPGVGIDLCKFENLDVDRKELRKKFGFSNDDVVLVSVGELNLNKNHQLVVNAIAGMENSKIHYLIAGEGENRKSLECLIEKLGMVSNIHLLGYRTDILQIYQLSDVFIFPSFREGLSVALMEAMASGLPCVVSRIRGNVDLIDEQGGTLFCPTNVEEVQQAISKVIDKDRNAYSQYNRKKIKMFSREVCNQQLLKLYLEK